MMRAFNLFGFLLAAVILCCSPSQALAATLQINDLGQLTGATGVNVNGVLWDVNFQDDTCVALFSGCNEVSDFQLSPTTRAAAATALFEQVFIGEFDEDPSRACSH